MTKWKQGLRNVKNWVITLFQSANVTFEIELSCLLFLSIIFEMFLHLDFSPNCEKFNWVWHHLHHLSLCEESQLTTRIMAETKPWGGMSCLQSSDPGKATEIALVGAWRVPEGTVAFILLTTRTPQAACLTKPSSQGTKNLLVPLAELQRACVEMS